MINCYKVVKIIVLQTRASKHWTQYTVAGLAYLDIKQFINYQFCILICIVNFIV